MLVHMVFWAMLWIAKNSRLLSMLAKRKDKNLAIFAGAGMSTGTGFVNWAELLRPTAEELNLDVDKEHNLVTVSQYHCNQHGNNRSQLNQRLIKEFRQKSCITAVHHILARLLISTFWTTN